MSTETRKARVERDGKSIKLWVPYQDKEVAFAYPSAGSGRYRDVGAEILERKQRLPLASETASLIETSYCDKAVKGEPELKNVRDLMKSNYIWVFNRNLWTKDGVF